MFCYKKLLRNFNNKKQRARGQVLRCLNLEEVTLAPTPRGYIPFCQPPLLAHRHKAPKKKTSTPFTFHISPIHGIIRQQQKRKKMSISQSNNSEQNDNENQITKV